jgi:hypothetical protein
MEQIMSNKRDALPKKSADVATRKHGERSRKHVPKPAKSHAKHHAKRAAKDSANRSGMPNAYATDHGLMTAFHHMQRASVVISLMERSTGADLRNLLERGVKLYRRAIEENTNEKLVLRAIGVLRASEHLSMAGLYAAREKHRQKVVSPTPEWLKKVIGEVDHRLEEIATQKRGKGVDLFPVTLELVRQAEDAAYDAHLSFELAMAGDALCFALENGL